MNPSVIDPISQAIDRVGVILFKPFDIGKWFVMGFCAFLAYLGEGGGGPSFNYQFSGGGGGPGGGSPGPTPSAVLDWIQDNLGLVIGIGAILLVIIFAVGLLITWISSRGKFMFLDGVVYNRAAVIEPWKKFRKQGNSYFLFRIVLGLIGFVVFIAIAALAAAIAWSDITARQFGSGALEAVVVGVLLMLVFAIIFALIGAMFEDFVVPIMYLGDLKTMAAFGLFRREILASNKGVIVLFYLMKVLLGIALAIIAGVVTCLTCCAAALPYLGSVILLPLLMFSRCYSLYMLEQFGPPWMVFPQPYPKCPRCGYDLRGSAGQATCPECGAALPQGALPAAGPEPG